MDYFEELKKVSDACYLGQIESGSVFAKALELIKISDPKFKTRQDNGEPFQLNFSVPKSLENALVVGIRYRKVNGDNREDHFVFTRKKVIKCYGKKLEGVASEYKGAHTLKIEI